MDFKSRYRRECLLKGTSPLHIIEAYLSDFVLNFKFFRIPVSEWNPILSVLSSDLTLKRICVTIDDVDHTMNNPTHQQKVKHLQSFVESLCVHLHNNQNLTELELVGLPLSCGNVKHLAKGIFNSNSLQHLCLAGCKIGDEGSIHIVEAIKMKPNIVWLDLRSCGLTSKIGQTLYDLVHFQRVARENAVWKASLRQEIPDLDLMGGLRRLTVSDNPLSDATTCLASALDEDRWIKAIDLQFCNMENTNLKELITAVEKNCSMVFLDVQNNFLNPDLVLKLKEILKCNSVKHPSFLFKPITIPCNNLPVHSKNAHVQVHVKNKTFHSNEKSCKIKPIHKTEKPIEKTRIVKKELVPKQRRKTYESDMKLTKIKATHNKQSNMREDLKREKTLHNDAELQVIKIYHEMESAWIRITKLEKEVKQLNKHKKPSTTLTFSDPTLGLKIEASNDPSTQSFQICLRRLQDVLKELKLASASQHWDESKNSREEIQKILDIVYDTVREFGPNMKQMKLDHQHQTNNFHDGLELQPYSEAYTKVIQKKEDNTNRVKHTVSNGSTSLPDDCNLLENQRLSNFPSLQTDLVAASTLDYPVRNAKKTLKSPHNQFEIFDQVSIKDNAAKTNDESVYSKKNPNIESPLNSRFVDSASIKSLLLTDRSFRRKKQNEGSFVSPQHLAQNTEGDTRINSLKSLQSNLEQFLEQLQKKSDDGSFDRMRQSQSQLTITGNLPDLSMTNQEAESHYSTDFDSLSSTSVRNISATKDMRADLSHKDPIIYPDKKRKGEKQASQEQNISFSSSSLNLSSIVDLLGNFSVEDIGSSTLTPP